MVNFLSLTEAQFADSDKNTINAILKNCTMISTNVPTAKIKLSFYCCVSTIIHSIPREMMGKIDSFVEIIKKEILRHEKMKFFAKIMLSKKICQDVIPIIIKYL